MKLPWLALFFLGSIACRSEPPMATGRLARPAGLAIVERMSPPAATTVVREDLLIADSESNGLKILQYQGNDINFVPAPVVFFPLVIPAPNFPTEVVAQFHPASGFADRAYVLSSGDDALHILDITPIDFLGTSLDNDGNRLLETIDLSTLAGRSIPTDIALIDDDIIAVAFEGISEPDRLFVIRASDATVLGRAEVEPLPRGIAVRGAGTDDVRVLVSSGSRFVAEVALDQSFAVAGVRRIDVGGPTGDMIDAGPQGAFALRSDRPRVVHLLPGPNGLERSTANITSPFTPMGERRTSTIAGTLDVYPSPIGAAAIGFVEEMIDPNVRGTVNNVTGLNSLLLIGAQRVFRRTSGDLPVLMMAHADGSLSFVVVEANTASVATSLESYVARVTTSTMVTVQAIDPDAGNAPIGSCATTLCSDVSLAVPNCPSAIVRDEQPFNAIYRAVYRGPLVRSQSPQLTRIDSGVYSISDPEVASYQDRLVRVGDLVLTQAQSQNCVDLTAPMDLIATGTVTRVEGSVVEVAYPPSFDLVQTCDDQSLPFVTQRLEIYPSGNEMVLARYVGGSVAEVLARQPVITDQDGSRVEFVNRIAVRISAPIAFACEQGERRSACTNDLECGVGRNCQASPSGIPGCFGTCVEACAEPKEQSCVRDLIGRECTSVEIEVLPSVPFVVSANASEGNTVLPAAAPAGAAFSPNRDAWVISFPGSRRLVEFVIVRNTDTKKVENWAVFHIR